MFYKIFTVVIKYVLYKRAVIWNWYLTSLNRLEKGPGSPGIDRTKSMLRRCLFTVLCKDFINKD